MTSIRLIAFMLVSLVGHAAILIPLSNELAGLFDGNALTSDTVVVSISVISNPQDMDRKSVRPDELYHAFREQAPLVHPPVIEPKPVSADVAESNRSPVDAPGNALTAGRSTRVVNAAARVQVTQPLQHKETPQVAMQRQPEIVPESDEPPARVSSQLTSASIAASSLRQARQMRLEAESAYLGELLQAISRFRMYPSSARRRGHQGSVEIDLVIRRNGEFESVEISKPSDYKTLNRASSRAINKLKQFKPFPDEIDRESWRLSIPFRYVLRNNPDDSS